MGTDSVTTVVLAAQGDDVKLQLVDLFTGRHGKRRDVKRGGWRANAPDEQPPNDSLRATQRVIVKKRAAQHGVVGRRAPKVFTVEVGHNPEKQPFHTTSSIPFVQQCSAMGAGPFRLQVVDFYPKECAAPLVPDEKLETAEPKINNAERRNAVEAEAVDEREGSVDEVNTVDLVDRFAGSALEYPHYRDMHGTLHSKEVSGMYAELPKHERLSPLSDYERSVIKRTRSLPNPGPGDRHLLCGKHFQRLLNCNAFMSSDLMDVYAQLVNKRNAAFFGSSGCLSLVTAEQPGCSRPESGTARVCSPLSTRSGLIPSSHPAALVHGGRLRTWILSSYFFPLLVDEGYCFDRVKRWSSIAKRKIPILQFGRIMIPVHRDEHFVLAYIDIRCRRFWFLDPLHNADTNEVVPTLKCWLFDAVKEQYGEEVALKLDIAEWKVVTNPPYAPRQRDVFSCGVFTLMTADFLELGRVPEFGQAHTPVLRQRIALALLSGTLLNI